MMWQNSNPYFYIGMTYSFGFLSLSLFCLYLFKERRRLRSLSEEIEQIEMSK